MEKLKRSALGILAFTLTTLWASIPIKAITTESLDSWEAGAWAVVTVGAALAWAAWGPGE